MSPTRGRVQGKIARVSGYDPLDLFSRDLARQMQALESLVSDPQNNLRVWVARASVDKSNLSTWVAAQQPGMTRILQVRAIPTILRSDS